MSEGERRLAAIMYTDIVGYTSLTQRDEALAMQLLEEHRRLVRPFFPKHNGREIKTVGDEFLVEFSSALEAVRCAFDIQQSMHEMNNGRLPEKQVQLRIGVHVGDVIHSQNDVYGDAVNVASRIEPLAMPGGICVSQQVYDHVKNQFEFPLMSVGKRDLKNVGEPMEVFKVTMPWEQSATTEALAFPTNRIAILPFTSFSSNPDDAYFADGMTEEVISTVSGISGLEVISRTSVMRYKKTEKAVEEIGRELKVGTVLEGSFRKAGNRIRVTTQLIDVAKDRHLWAQNYDRNMDDIFEVQSDVAKQVADALKIKILSSEKERIEKRPTENTSAYGLYLKGKYYLNKRGLEDLKKAREYFELALHEDPDFALGYVGVSDCCALLRNNWLVEPEANLVKAKAMMSKALELDAGLAEAHATRGLLSQQEYDLRGAEREYTRAVELKPSYAMAHLWYYLLLACQVRLDEAREQIEKALELDPMAPIVQVDYGAYCRNRGDYGRAIESFRKSIELGMTLEHEGLGFTYGLMGKFDDMKREYAAYVEVAKDSVPLAQLYADVHAAYFMDDKETVRRLLPELEAHFGDERGPEAFFIGLFQFYLGEIDKAFEWLERSYSRKEGDLLGIKAEQLLGFFKGIQDDPRYLDLLKRLGLE